MMQIDKSDTKHLTSESNYVKRKDNISFLLSEEDKRELIELIKFMEGFKRKLLPLLK
jgi:hypothetical protein